MQRDVCYQQGGLRRFDRRLVWSAVLLVAGLTGCGGNSPSGNDASEERYRAARPAAQVQFSEIVSSSQQKARDAKNDMQLGGIKGERDRLICNSVAGIAGDWWANPDPMTALERMGKPIFSATNWVGKVKTLDATSDGFGVLVIEVEDGVTVGTTNNAISDVSSETLIRQTSPLFAQVSTLSEGQWVMFSGSFLTGTSGDCFSEMSMSLAGKLRSPEFVFRFSEVSPMVLPFAPGVDSASSITETAVVLPSPQEQEAQADTSELAIASAELPAESSVPQAQKASTPSFDCAKASTLVESTICADPLLARLDAALAKTYGDIRASDIGEDARSYLRTTQREWIRERNECSDVRCIETAYRNRIDEVCGTPVLSGVHPACPMSDEIN